jgi:hypothetical protein
VIDENLTGEVRVTVIATGIGEREAVRPSERASVFAAPREKVVAFESRRVAPPIVPAAPEPEPEETMVAERAFDDAPHEIERPAREAREAAREAIRPAAAEETFVRAEARPEPAEGHASRIAPLSAFAQRAGARGVASVSRLLGKRQQDAPEPANGGGNGNGNGKGSRVHDLGRFSTGHVDLDTPTFLRKQMD